MYSSHDIRQAENGYNVGYGGYERAAYPHNSTYDIVSSRSPSFTSVDNQNASYDTSHAPQQHDQVPRKRIRRRDPNHIPRPRNAFFIFRSSYVASPYTTMNGKEHQNDLSKQAAHAWAMMTEDQKRPFRVRAQIEMDEHRQKYPDFNYSTKSCSKPRKSKSPMPGEQTMTWTWSPPSSETTFMCSEDSTHDYKPALLPVDLAPPNTSSPSTYPTMYLDCNMLAYNERCYDSEVFLPDPPALHPTFAHNSDVSQQHGINAYPSSQGMDHAFPFYPRYSDTEDIEPSFSDIFLSMVDNINPQDYDSSFSSSLALYSSSSYSLPIPSDDPQYSEINYL